MNKLFFTAALLVATTVACGQTIPTYLGIGIADPVGTLHVHSYEKVEDLHEPIFIQEVERDGADLGEMNRVLLQKVEELTLYIIDLQRQIDELKSN